MFWRLFILAVGFFVCLSIHAQAPEEPVQAVSKRTVLKSGDLVRIKVLVNGIEGIQPYGYVERNGAREINNFVTLGTDPGDPTHSFPLKRDETGEWLESTVRIPGGDPKGEDLVFSVWFDSVAGSTLGVRGDQPELESIFPKIEGVEVDKDPPKLSALSAKFVENPVEGEHPDLEISFTAEDPSGIWDLAADAFVWKQNEKQEWYRDWAYAKVTQSLVEDGPWKKKVVGTIKIPFQGFTYVNSGFRLYVRDTAGNTITAFNDVDDGNEKAYPFFEVDWTGAAPQEQLDRGYGYKQEEANAPERIDSPAGLKLDKSVTPEVTELVFEKID